MFITKINTKCKHIDRYHISNMILEMCEIADSNIQNNTNLEFEIHAKHFWIDIKDFYQNYASLKNRYIDVKYYINDVLTNYELGLIRQISKTNSIYALHYTLAFGHQDFEMEPIIIDSARCSYAYAAYVLKRAFPLGEKIIATSAEYSYWYARNILKGKFELGEEAISTDPYYSLWYAKDVIKGRFELGEETIKNTDSTYCDYREFYETCFHITL